MVYESATCHCIDLIKHCNPNKRIDLGASEFVTSKEVYKDKNIALSNQQARNWKKYLYDKDQETKSFFIMMSTNLLNTIVQCFLLALIKVMNFLHLFILMFEALHQFLIFLAQNGLFHSLMIVLEQLGPS